VKNCELQLANQKEPFSSVLQHFKTADPTSAPCGGRTYKMKRFKKKRENKKAFNKLQDDGDNRKDLSKGTSRASTRYVMLKDEDYLIQDLFEDDWSNVLILLVTW